MTAEFAIVPGRGLGPFTLGSTLNDTLATIDALNATNNYLLYDWRRPFHSSIILIVSSIGVRLRFDSHRQRLSLIDAYQPSSLSLRYLHHPINDSSSGSSSESGTRAMTVSMVYNAFGPTYSAQYQSDHRCYLLQYPGIAFVFNHSASASDSGDSDRFYHCVSNGFSPIIDRILIHTGDSLPPSPPLSLPLTITDSEPVQLHLHRGIFLPKRHQWLTFECHSQDVLMLLGKPESVYHKHDEKMAIHTHADTADTATRDYFWNYFNLGLDVVFDGMTHRCKSFLLHCNAPTLFDFTRYHKCSFTLQPGDGDSECDDGICTGSDVGSIDSDQRWEQFHDWLTSVSGSASERAISRPMIHTGASNNVSDESTLFYAANGVLFEVLTSSSYLASVTLFDHRGHRASVKAKRQCERPK